MKPSIEVHNVWKEYNRYKGPKNKSMREYLSSWSNFTFQNEKFWSLQDIHFTVDKGERIGIIGSNGAGKSTLLKIMSRISPPTKGSIVLRGVVASLLEVGTGFHLELSGIENIYFYGSMLGMRKNEIDRSLDEIIEFSEVSDSINSPLKHYSSGMQMRLAFSVAAHLRSDILLVDEALAVGDANFQEKCIGKMSEIQQEFGKTILFVSHDISALSQVCQKAIVLDQGKIIANGDLNSSISTYLQGKKNQGINWSNIHRFGSGILQFNHMEVQGSALYTYGSIPIVIGYTYAGNWVKDAITIDLIINNVKNQKIAAITIPLTSDHLQQKRVEITLLQAPFTAGEYNCSLVANVNHKIADWVQHIGHFEMIDSAKLPTQSNHYLAQTDIALQFSIEK